MKTNILILGKKYIEQFINNFLKYFNFYLKKNKKFIELKIYLINIWIKLIQETKKNVLYIFYGSVLILLEK